MTRARPLGFAVVVPQNESKCPLSFEIHHYEDFRQKNPAPSMSMISSLMPWARR